jgi:hypothetical protein
MGGEDRVQVVEVEQETLGAVEELVELQLGGPGRRWVEDRPPGRGDRQASASDGLLRRQCRRAMDPDPGPRGPAARADGHVDRVAAVPAQRPRAGGAPMAEHGAVTAGENGGPQAPV